MFSRFLHNGRRPFSSLSEQEILALAISSEEDDARIYLAYAEGLRGEYPHSARIFEKMAEEEHAHRDALIERHRARFGEHIPLIRREHVSGYFTRKPDWLVRPLGIDKVRDAAAQMEEQAYRFYSEAARHVTDAGTRRLLGELAIAEKQHEKTAEALERTFVPGSVRDEEHAAERKRFLLTFVQPGLAGLMDGSVSTLAPIFAAAFATGDTWQTFLVGLSASLGAGISMGFTEAVHDDGRLSGRGSPVWRGLSCGIMTALGGLGHALPYLIHDFRLATTLAVLLVFCELWAIAYIQNRFMETPFFRSVLQVVLGGGLVLGVGILIGNA